MKKYETRKRLQERLRYRTEERDLAQNERDKALRKLEVANERIKQIGAASRIAESVAKPLIWSAYTPLVGDYTVEQAKRLWPRQVYLDCSGSVVRIEKIRCAIWTMGQNYFSGVGPALVDFDHRPVANPRPKPELFGFSTHVEQIETYADMASRSLGMGTDLVHVFQHAQDRRSIVITDEHWELLLPRGLLLPTTGPVKVPDNITILTVRQARARGESPRLPEPEKVPMNKLIGRMNKIIAQSSVVTEDDSAFIKRFLDHYPPGTPEGDIVFAAYWPEANEWANEQAEGRR